MNLPNLLTLSRIPLLFVISGLIYLEKPGAASLAFLLFVFAGLTDWLDGYIARKYNLISNFGKLMDALADKVIIVGMFIILLAIGMLPPWAIWCVLLIVSREFLVTGLRLVAAGKGVVLGAEATGKHKTVVQIVCISVLLLVPVLKNDIGSLTGWKSGATVEFVELVGLILFVVATILTVFSGCRYLAKYWAVMFEAQG